MESMEQIYKMHARTVYGFLLTRTGSPDLAEELTQETFYQALKSSDSFKGDSNVATWLCGIAKRVLGTYLKKQKRQDAYFAAMNKSGESGRISGEGSRLSNEDIGCVSMQASDAVCQPSAEDSAMAVWDSMQVVKLLHGLKEPMREVMYLRLIGNLSFAQIGEIMGQSENWARVNFYRGKEKVMKEVFKDGK